MSSNFSIFLYFLLNNYYIKRITYCDFGRIHVQAISLSRIFARAGVCCFQFFNAGAMDIGGPAVGVSPELQIFFQNSGFNRCINPGIKFDS